MADRPKSAIRCRPGRGLVNGTMERESASAPASPYQVFMLALCILALAMLAYEGMVAVDPETRAVLGTFDLIVCAVFFVDFLVSLARARDRWHYLTRWGWIDLLSSVPTLDLLRWGRAARVARALRILRGAKAAKTLGQFIVERRSEGAGLAAALITLLLVASSSIAILHFEKVALGANILSADDAIWWAFTTVTTVGYGDRYPVSGEGRVVGVILMLGGMGLLATISGLLAAWFLGPRSTARDHELARMREDLGEVRRLLEAASPRRDEK